MRPSPFYHRQDYELGKALRTVLSGRDEAAFVSRVLERAAVQQGRADSATEWWDVLYAWARPGLAAATIALAAAISIWLTGTPREVETAVALSDPLQESSGSQVAAAFLTAEPPDLNEVLAIELGN